MEGFLFVTDDADIMNVQLNASSNVLVITRYFTLFFFWNSSSIVFSLKLYATYILVIWLGDINFWKCCLWLIASTYLRIDALHYILRGNVVGVVTLRASARRTNGRILQSQSHSIQVYAPLQLQPKLITLIPDSVFQVP